MGNDRRATGDGFTEEELDFIINYDIKYRMGDQLNGVKSMLGRKR